MPSLYELSHEFRAVTDAIEDADGEIGDDIAPRLDAISLAFPAKMDAVAKWHAELRARAVGLAAEAKRIADLAAAASRRADSVKEYMRQAMEAAGVKKLETTAHVLSVCRNSACSVTLAEGADIPEGFARTKTEVTLDRDAVLEIHKAGLPLPETINMTQGTHLRIK